jgi:hypothetical protein
MIAYEIVYTVSNRKISVLLVTCQLRYRCYSKDTISLVIVLTESIIELTCSIYFIVV